MSALSNLLADETFQLQAEVVRIKVEELSLLEKVVNYLQTQEAKCATGSIAQQIISGILTDIETGEYLSKEFQVK